MSNLFWCCYCGLGCLGLERMRSLYQASKNRPRLCIVLSFLRRGSMLFSEYTFTARDRAH
ncbi:unnamed protein product [Amoebophrya sp. A120]|nr:unnamed protein product [Amoebophrya sp. A120]|eukprot:GSA120T00020090001.1